MGKRASRSSSNDRMAAGLGYSDSVARKATCDMIESGDRFNLLYERRRKISLSPRLENLAQKKTKKKKKR